MNKTDLITYLMNEYQAALHDFEAEKAWRSQEYDRVEKLKKDNKEAGRPVWHELWHGYYEGRHVSKAKLNRIRLMLQKAMLEVERS